LVRLCGCTSLFAREFFPLSRLYPPPWGFGAPSHFRDPVGVTVEFRFFDLFGSRPCFLHPLVWLACHFLSDRGFFLLVLIPFSPTWLVRLAPVDNPVFPFWRPFGSLRRCCLTVTPAYFSFDGTPWEWTKFSHFFFGDFPL